MNHRCLRSLSALLLVALSACNSPTGSNAPPSNAGDAYLLLHNVLQGLTDVSLIAGFARSDGTVWFGGTSGALLSRQGGNPWSLKTVSGEPTITGVWADTDELLVSSALGIQKKTAGGWQLLPVPKGNSQLLELFGLDSDHLWAGGSGGVILFRDHQLWKRATVPVSGEIWGLVATSPSEVIAVGQSGLILQSDDGVTFEEVASPTINTLFSVASDGAGRFVAVGAGGTIVLRDGDTWELVPVPTSANLFAVSSNGPRSFLAVGDNGVMLSGDGVVWSPVESGGGAENLRAITGAGNQRIVAGWFGSIIEESYGWKTSHTGTRFYAVNEPITGNPLMVGRGGIAYERVGSNWREVATPTKEILLGVAGLSGDDQLVVGDHGTVFHVVGDSWTGEAVPTQLAVRDVWYKGYRALAVGDGGKAMVRENGVWHEVPTGTTKYLRHVWGNSFDRLWAVGDSGTILRWDGTSFTSMSLPISTILRGGFSRNSGDTWIVGDGGLILRLNSGNWVQQPSPTMNDIRAIHAVGNVLYIAGAAGQAFALIDGEWQSLGSNNPTYWLGLGGIDELIAVGETGTIATGVK